MSKMGSHDPFGQLKHELWPKEQPWIKLTIWLLATKSRESPRFPCMQVTCDIPLESFQWGLQLYFIFNLNQRFSHKVVGDLILGISGLSLRSLETKWHLGASLVARHKEHYKREGGGFLQIRAMVSFMSVCLPVACLCTKGVPTRH